MITRRTITTAFLLLFAAAVSVGGPASLHLLGDHLSPAPEAQCCDTTSQQDPAPADQDAPEDDCPECDLLTTLAFADTGASAELISATTTPAAITTIAATPATVATHAPRTTRGPPAA